MARVVLINGAPGSGKSTLALALAQDSRMALALDVDAIEHSLGRWEENPSDSGLHARVLSLAMAEAQLSAGLDLFIGQYLARTHFIDELQALAERHGAAFREFVLQLDAATLRQRLRERNDKPDRPEHAVNNRLVGPEDANALAHSLEALRSSRPQAVWVDARGPLSSTLGAIRGLLVNGEQHADPTPGQST